MYGDLTQSAFLHILFLELCFLQMDLHYLLETAFFVRLIFIGLALIDSRLLIELSVVDQILLSFTSCMCKCIDGQIIEWEGS